VQLGMKRGVDGHKHELKTAQTFAATITKKKIPFLNTSYEKSITFEKI
jgi:hypothetical protein